MRRIPLLPRLIAVTTLAASAINALSLAGCASGMGRREAGLPNFSGGREAGRTVYLVRPMALWLPPNIQSKEYPYLLVEKDNVPSQAGGSMAILPVGLSVRVERAQGYRLMADFFVSALGSVEDPKNHKVYRFEYICRNGVPMPWKLPPS